MIVTELLEVLKQNNFVVCPFEVDLKENDDNTIIYTFDNVTNDGVISQDKFSVKIISNDMEKCYKNLDRLKNVLLTIGDEPLTHNILSVTLNGGGSLYNYETDTVLLKADFIVKSRVRN